MDLIFNELSFLHIAEDKYNARDIMKNLLHSCKLAKKLGTFGGLRVRPDFFVTDLAENYTVNNWLTDHSVPRNYINLLLTWKRYPYINENDESIEDRFIQNYYYLAAPGVADLHGLEVEGLAVAFLYNTLAISLASNVFWRQTKINLLERIGSNEQTVQVRHVSSSDHIQEHKDWVVSCRPVELVESKLAETEKEISLRDDHGKDILQIFSQRLLHSPYVEKVINSLPFNPHDRNFIKNIFPDGKIEIVLIWADRGLGCVLQTTGRNLQETKKIADILEGTFG